MSKKQQTTHLIQALLASRQNANIIVEVLDLLSLNESADLIMIALEGVRQFFSSLLQNGELQRHILSEKGSTHDKMDEYRTWICQRYEDCVSVIITLLRHDSSAVREKCISTLFKFIEEENKYSIVDTEKNYFPELLLKTLLEGIIDSNQAVSMEKVYSKHWEIGDMRYFALKVIPKCLDSHRVHGLDSSQFYVSIFTILKSISGSMPNDTSEHNPNMEVSNELVEVRKKSMETREQRKIFTSAWLEFLKLDLNEKLFKNILVIVHKNVIPHFTSPCLLAEFLTRSLQQGGGVALLALHGLFILMNEHNLEYPKFYIHLYGMIHPRIFDARYRPRFFYLLNIFLTSSHLPAYLVAAFAKKLSRLMLVSPVHCLLLLVPFIFNLLDRHPSIRVLVDRAENHCKGFENDPFVTSETDPAECRAMESSLWELETLKAHNSSLVFESITKASHSSSEQDIEDLLEMTNEQIFNEFSEKDVTEAPMNHIKPLKIFGGFEDTCTSLWAL